ncbi:MFS transporter [Patescibacteria group bacterium]|nr:MFS transporter [Patescibacteria group bacterium]
MKNKNIRLLAWFNFFSEFKPYAPLAIIYFSQVTGSYALGTSIFSISMISSALFEVPTGILSDFIGRKKTLVLGAFCAILYTSFYALGFSYWILVLGAIIEGVSRSFYSGNNDALLYDTLVTSGDEKNYHHYLGKISSTLQLSAGISALIGGIVAGMYFPGIFWLSAFSQIVGFTLSLKMTEPKFHGNESGNVYNHLKESIKCFIQNPKLRLLSISTIFGYGFSESAYQFRSTFFAMVIPFWLIGVVAMITDFGATLGFFISGKVIDKFGSFKIMLFGSIYNRIIGFTSLILASPISPFLMATPAFHYGVSTVAKNTLMQKEFTDRQRATMGSLNSFAGSLFLAVVFLGIGLVADKLTPIKALIIIEMFMMFNVFIYWRLFKNYQKK